MSILSNFSRLVIDPSLPICNSELIRNHYLENETPVSINIDGYRLWERLSDFYLEYQKILREAMIFLDVPKQIISVHSHVGSDTLIYRPYTSRKDLLIDRLEIKNAKKTYCRDELINCGPHTLESLISF